MDQDTSNKKILAAVLAQLKNPFPANLLKYRIGATTKDKKRAIPLFYLTARDVEKRLDDVFGFGGWSKDTELITTQNGLVAAKTTIWVTLPDGTSLHRDGIGEPTKVAGPLGAESQSLKRAAANLGIGRYLYYLDAGWQELDEHGRFKSDPRKNLPNWALPDEKLPDWKSVAQEQYNSDGDLDLENLPPEIASTEEIELLKKSEEIKKKILAKAKES